MCLLTGLLQPPYVLMCWMMGVVGVVVGGDGWAASRKWRRGREVEWWSGSVEEGDRKVYTSY